MAAIADTKIEAAPTVDQMHENGRDRAIKDEPEYLRGWALTSLAGALMAGSFLLALDHAVISTAIPQMTSDFNSLDDIGWYGAAYPITQMVLIPTCGRLYTFYNIKWTYVAMSLVFWIGSIICAAAPTSIAFIIGRAVAGLGAAGQLSGATLIISYCVELKQRALVMGFIFAVYGIGSVAGPLIGGVITDNKTLTWRFVFWLNLPVGAVALTTMWFSLRNPPQPLKAGLSPAQKLRQMDLPGATLLIGSVTCLLLALQWGGSAYPWSDSRVFGCLIGFGLLLIVFLILQFRDQVNCTIPLHVFRSRTVCAACGFTFFIQIALVSQIYYWPIYFQSVKNDSAKDSGIYLLPLVISNGLASLVVGWVISKIGHYVPFMWAGAPLLAIGGGLYQLIDPHSPSSEWIGYQIVSGLGYGIAQQIPILSVQVVLDKVDVPTGCVMVIFFQCLGSALATSIGQNLFVDKLIQELHQVDGIDATAIVDAGAKDFRKLVPMEFMDAVIGAFGSALKNVFILATATAAMSFVVSLAMEWRRIPKDRRQEDPGSGALA